MKNFGGEDGQHPDKKNLSVLNRLKKKERLHFKNRVYEQLSVKDKVKYLQKLAKQNQKEYPLSQNAKLEQIELNFEVNNTKDRLKMSLARLLMMQATKDKTTVKRSKYTNSEIRRDLMSSFEASRKVSKLNQRRVKYETESKLWNNKHLRKITEEGRNLEKLIRGREEIEKLTKQSVATLAFSETVFGELEADPDSLSFKTGLGGRTVISSARSSAFKGRERLKRINTLKPKRG